MAVIRERQQFRNQRIGVVRADTGQTELWRQVGATADNLVANVFEVAKAKAEQKGIELAEQFKQEDLLRTIDPATGRAEAFTVPTNLGTIAQTSYNNTMRRRYIRTAEDEIKTKAAELSIKHQYDPHGPENYAVSMQDYIENMVKVTDPNFSEVIKELGSSYLASTKLNLMSKRAAAIANVEAMGLQQDAHDFASNINDFGSDTDSMMLAFEMESMAQDDAVQAGILSPSQANENKRNMRRAIQQAPLANILVPGSMIEDVDASGNTITREITPADAVMLENAYRSKGNPEVVNRLPKGVRKVYDQSIVTLMKEGEDLDWEKLKERTNEYGVDLKGAYTATAKALKTESLIVDIANMAGDNSDKKYREAADEMVFRSSQLANRQQYSVYYRTEESLANVAVKSSIAKGVIPDRLLTDLENLSNGMDFPPEQTQILLQHYLRYANYTKRIGAPINMLVIDGGLSGEEDAILNSVARIAQIRGSQDFPTIMAEVTANSRNKEVIGDRINKLFAGNNEVNSVEDYVLSKFDNDVATAQRLEPYARNLIANGITLKELDAEMERIYNGVYVETAGFVIDPLASVNANRSLYALDRVIPNQELQDMFLMDVQEALPEGYHLGKSHGDKKRVYLVPQDLSGTGLSDELGSIGVVYHAMYKNEIGELVPVPNQSDGEFQYMSFSIRGYREEAKRIAEEMRKAEIEAGQPSSLQIMRRELESRTGKIEQPLPADLMETEAATEMDITTP